MFRLAQSSSSRDRSGVDYQSMVDRTDLTLESGTKGNNFGHHAKRRGEPPAEVIGPFDGPTTHEWLVLCFSYSCIDAKRYVLC
jgi:hypothetical protein